MIHSIQHGELAGSLCVEDFETNILEQRCFLFFIVSSVRWFLQLCVPFCRSSSVGNNYLENGKRFLTRLIAGSHFTIDQCTGQCQQCFWDGLSLTGVAEGTGELIFLFKNIRTNRLYNFSECSVKVVWTLNIFCN